MKLLLYFFYTIAVLAIITFTYDLVKLGTFNWSSLAITISMIGFATGLKKSTKNIQLKSDKINTQCFKSRSTTASKTYIEFD